MCVGQKESSLLMESTVRIQEIRTVQAHSKHSINGSNFVTVMADNESCLQDRGFAENLLRVQENKFVEMDFGV